MTIDRFAEKYTSMNPYQYGANNPIKFIDFNGDSIVWAQDKASQAYMNHVLQMRQESKLFAAVYDYLDGLSTVINVRVDDAVLQERYQKATKGNDPEGRAGGVSTNGGTSIIFSDVHGDQTTSASEEFFHSFQRLGAYADNPRRSQEMDAEAKLFNASVLQELSPTGSSLIGAAKVIDDINRAPSKSK